MGRDPWAHWLYALEKMQQFGFLKAECQIQDRWEVLGSPRIPAPRDSQQIFLEKGHFRPLQRLSAFCAFFRASHWIASGTRNLPNSEKRADLNCILWSAIITTGHPLTIVSAAVSLSWVQSRAKESQRLPEWIHSLVKGSTYDNIWHNEKYS